MASLIRAPELPSSPDTLWLNIAHPLRFSHELKGHVVLLDFWTYCCINCLHVLPDLEYLERVFRDRPVVIIGVHSNKFANEGNIEMIRAAVERHHIRHPVVVDEGRRIWDSFTVRSWPTLILIGADGRVIGQVSGEGHRTILEKSIARALADAERQGILSTTPLVWGAEALPRNAAQLSFPGKVIADCQRRRLLIVDSNHHRLLLTAWPNAEGVAAVHEIIGSGRKGSADGGFTEAEFHRPQGAAFGGGEVIYVADTDNHLLRRVDLERKRITTILGNGTQKFDPEAGKSGRAQALNSPWDVAPLGNRLYISQAGQHQIFAMNLMTGMTEIAAGSGRESLRDGEAANAQLAQPSGLALDAKNRRLYFADSETSAIRFLDLDKKEVVTLLGRGLFDFGDIDGDAAAARLQHPLGVSLAADGDALLIADTYNHKIKRFHLADHRIETIQQRDTLQLCEPSSVAEAGDGSGDLFVADTNQHRIVRINPAAATWQVLQIEGLENP